MGTIQYVHDPASRHDQVRCRLNTANDTAVFLLHPKIVRLGCLQDAVAVLASEVEQRVLAGADNTLDKWLGHQFALRKRVECRSLRCARGMGIEQKRVIRIRAYDRFHDDSPRVEIAKQT